MNSPQPTGIHRAFQIFQVSRQASLILTGILLAQSGLSGYDIGQYEMLAYCGYVLSFFWITGLLQGWMIAAPQSSGIQQKRLHWLVGGSLLGLSLLATSLLWLPGEPVSAFFTHQKPLPFVRLYALYLLFSLPAYLTEYLWVLQQKAKWILWYGTGTLALQVMGLMIPIWLGYGLEGGLWGLLAVGIIRFLVAAVQLFTLKETVAASETVSKMPQQNWWQLSWPLVLYALLGGFAQAFDFWLLGRLYPGDTLKFAQFRFGAREFPLALALVSAFNTTLLPEVSADTKAAPALIRQKSLRLMHILFPITLLGLVVSEPLFPLIFSPEFAVSAGIFNVYLLLHIPRVVFPHTLLSGMGHTRVLLYTGLAELLLNALVSWHLAQDYGMVGIAFGTVVAYSFEKVVYAVFLFRKYGIQPVSYIPVQWWLGYSAATILVFGWVMG